jgi:hypothetical protein
MNVLKLVLYCGIFVLLFSTIPEFNERMLILYAYLALMYYDCKDQNIRSLIVILACFEVGFYELDYLLFLVSKDVWMTGPVAGDMLLDILILINFLVLILSIFYRCEIMELYNKLLHREPFQYLPTRADFVQISVIKAIMLVHAGFMLFTAYHVNEMNNSSGFAAELILRDLFNYSEIYIDIGDKLESIRHFSIVIVLSPWSKITKDKNDKLTTMDY